MDNVESNLDKSFASPTVEGYGTVTIRIVVLQKNPSAPPPDEGPVDAEPDELLPEKGDRPVSTFLEERKRGHQCCVFLINGQRQHAWDNSFIVRDLGLKYLRNRMLIVVDVDGLRPETIAELMQGTRHQFYEGKVYEALAARVIATLKDDPDLKRLEEEAEDDVSSLQAGDEVVKAQLDQLIQEHHDQAARVLQGYSQPGDESWQPLTDGPLSQVGDVVVAGDSSTGTLADEPFLLMRPDVSTIRLRPDETRRVSVLSKPESRWRDLENLTIAFDPPVTELRASHTMQIGGAEVSLTFDQPADFDEDEYPIETTLRATTAFKGFAEPRLLERRVVVNRSRTRPPKPPKPLLDVPTFLRVTSRQPIKVAPGGPDVHVKLRWDGKDELTVGTPPIASGAGLSLHAH